MKIIITNMRAKNSSSRYTFVAPLKRRTNYYNMLVLKRYAPKGNQITEEVKPKDQITKCIKIRLREKGSDLQVEGAIQSEA